MATLWENVQRAVEKIQSAGVSEPFASARTLMSSVLDIASEQVVLHRSRELNSDEAEKFWRLVERRAKGEPVAYILGRCEFFSIQLRVGQGALIPRPETEHVVEAALDLINRFDKPLILDLATGCGCIAIAIAKNSNRARIIASDVSKSALSWAARNVGEHGLSNRIMIVHADMVSCFAQVFDMVVCNPPYISESELRSISREVSGFEPNEALIAGESGLEFIARMLDETRRVIVPQGFLIFEISSGQFESIERLVRSCGWAIIDVRRDLANIQRVVVAKKA